MDFAQRVIVPPFVGAWSEFSALWELNERYTAASVSWPAVNKAIHIPVTLPWPYQLRRFWWVNGGTVTSNIDAGVFSYEGARLASTGSTAQSAANTIQYQAATTSVLLAPGRYYFSLACSGTTSRVFGANINSLHEGRVVGLLEQASALPLPSSMTGVALTGTAAAAPLFGITNT